MPLLDAAFQPELRAFDSELEKIIADMPLPDLGIGTIHAPLAKWLENATKTLTPMQSCGLLLLSGQLDASHEISQAVSTPEGSFWHGIMHRREGDFWNAKYWFRRVGKHPVLNQLAQTNYGDPSEFVDRVERATQSYPSDLKECRELQWQEWQSLFREGVLEN